MGRSQREDKRWLEEPIPFHDFTDAQTTRGNNDSRDSCPPSRGRPPLLASQSKLFKPFHAFSCQTKPFRARQNAPILPLNSSKSALSFGQFLPFRSFVILDWPRAVFHGIARNVMPRVGIIGSIFPAFAFVCWPLLLVACSDERSFHLFFCKLNLSKSLFCKLS